MNVYTDGGCQINPGYIGSWGFLIVKNEKIKNITSQTIIFKEKITNNIMEILSVKNAMTFLYKKRIKIINIYSDSKYVINCFCKTYKRIKHVSLWNSIDELKLKFKKVTIKWVQGHVNKYNIIIDKFMKILELYLRITQKPMLI